MGFGPKRNRTLVCAVLYNEVPDIVKMLYYRKKVSWVTYYNVTIAPQLQPIIL